MKTFVLTFLALAVSSSAFAQCGNPSNALKANDTIVVQTLYLKPPTPITILKLNADCSISGVGNQNYSGTWTVNGTLDLVVNQAYWIQSNPTTLSTLTMSFNLATGMVVGNIAQKSFIFSTGETFSTTISGANPVPGGPPSSFQVVRWP